MFSLDVLTGFRLAPDRGKGNKKYASGKSGGIEPEETA